VKALTERNMIELQSPAARTSGSSFALRGIYAAMAAVLAAYATSLIVRGPGGPTYTALDGWGVAGFELAAGVFILVRGVRHQRDRPYTLLLGIGATSWALGDFAMTYETLGGHTAPTLSVANFFWAGFFPFAYLAVMVLMRRDVRRFTAANYLDGVIATLAIACLIVAFAFRPIAAAAGAGNEFAAVNLVYPICDVLLSGLTVGGILLLPRGARARWYLIGTAGIVNAAGDTAALFPSLTASQVGWFLNVIAWPTSLLLIAGAVWLTRDPRVSAREQTASGFRIPAYAASVAIAILVYSVVHPSQAALIFIALTLATAGIRFVLALQRMNAINEQRHRDLETAAQAEHDSKHVLQRAVESYAAFAVRVAGGDLTATVAVDEDPELGSLAESLNTMVSGLAEISTEIQTGVHDIAASTAQILGSVSTHTDGASRQSSAISEATATVNELRMAADDSSARARDVASKAANSARVSDEGTEAVAALAEAMCEIGERTADIRKELVMLSDRAQQIGVITETVNELSSRSKLLALNATIEAARAGEHGRGFAVVADQVRDLADQSQAATARVEGILDEVRQATRASVAASEHGAEVVERALDLTTRADERIRNLARTIRDASDAAEQIASSAEFQSLSMDQIAAAMASIEDDTVQFVAGAQSSEAAAQRLTELSDKLSTLSERYRVSAAA
jgi:methyl-accepting chemotaxis protein